MKIQRLQIWPATLLLLATCAFGGQSRNNTAPNPSFEQGKGRQPVGWRFVRSSHHLNKLIWDRMVAHTGQASLCVDNRGLLAEKVGARWESERIPIKAGDTLSVSIWTRTVGNGRYGSILQLQMWNAQGKVLGKADRSRREEHDWAKIGVQAVAPQGTTSAVIVLILYDPGVVAWYDDVTLSVFPAPMPVPAEGTVFRNPWPVLAVPSLQPEFFDVSTSVQFPKGETIRVQGDRILESAARVHKVLAPGRWFWRAGYCEGKDQPVKLTVARSFVVLPPVSGRYAWDFGSRESPVEPGYKRVSPGQIFDGGDGFGWKAVSALRHAYDDTRYRVRDTGKQNLSSYSGRDRMTTYNTPLTRDFIEGVGEDTFIARVPNGCYEVTVIAGHSYRHHIHPYYEFMVSDADDQTLSFSKIVPLPFHEMKTLRTEVRDGLLQLHFDSNHGDRTWSVEGILVSPESQHWAMLEEREMIERSIRDLPDDVKASYVEMSAQESSSIRSAVTADMTALSAARGETAWALSKITPNENRSWVACVAPQLRRADGVLLDANATVWRLREKLLHTTVRMHSKTPVRAYVRVLDELEPAGVVDWLNKRTVRYMVELRVSSRAQPGHYTGTLSFTSDGAPFHVEPIAIDIHPFLLPKPDVCYGVYFQDTASRLDSNATPEARARSREIRQKLIADMSVGVQEPMMDLISVGVVVEPNEGSFGPDVAQILERYEAYCGSEIRPKAAFVQLQHSVCAIAKRLGLAQATARMDKHLSAPVTLPANFWLAFEGFVRKLDSALRKIGIEMVVYVPWDEAIGDDLPLFAEISQALSHVLKEPRILSNVTADRFYGFGDVAPETALKRFSNVVQIRFPITDLQREELLHEGYWLLALRGGSGGRIEWGFGAWQQGIWGVQFWAYDAWYASASSQLDGPAWGDGCLVYPYVPLHPRVRWVECQQGVTDLRYARALDAALNEAQRLGRDEAAERLTRVRKEIRSGLGQSDPARARQRIAQVLLGQ